MKTVKKYVDEYEYRLSVKLKNIKVELGLDNKFTITSTDEKFYDFLYVLYGSLYYTDFPGYVQNEIEVNGNRKRNKYWLKMRAKKVKISNHVSNDSEIFVEFYLPNDMFETYKLTILL